MHVSFQKPWLALLYTSSTNFQVWSFSHLNPISKITIISFSTTFKTKQQLNNSIRASLDFPITFQSHQLRHPSSFFFETKALVHTHTHAISIPLFKHSSAAFIIASKNNSSIAQSTLFTDTFYPQVQSPLMDNVRFRVWSDLHLVYGEKISARVGNLQRVLFG